MARRLLVGALLLAAAAAEPSITAQQGSMQLDAREGNVDLLVCGTCAVRVRAGDGAAPCDVGATCESVAALAVCVPPWLLYITIMQLNNGWLRAGADEHRRNKKWIIAVDHEQSAWRTRRRGRRYESTQRNKQRQKEERGVQQYTGAKDTTDFAKEVTKL